MTSNIHIQYKVTYLRKSYTIYIWLPRKYVNHMNQQTSSLYAHRHKYVCADKINCSTSFLVSIKWLESIAIILLLRYLRLTILWILCWKDVAANIFRVMHFWLWGWFIHIVESGITNMNYLWEFWLLAGFYHNCIEIMNFERVLICFGCWKIKIVFLI